MAGLEDVTSVRVPAEVLRETRDVLRHFGRLGKEALILWVGSVDGQTAVVSEALFPKQTPIESEDGIGYFVAQGALFELNVMLSEEKLRLLGQVHSHPGRAYHSDTDDRFAIVTSEGGFSIVVPNFASEPVTLRECAVYRLRSGAWTALTIRDIDSTFEVAD